MTLSTKKQLTGIKIDVEKQTIEKCTLENSLEAFYHALNCGSIECPTRVISGMHVIVVCDGEGLLKENQKPAVIGFDHVEVIVGNVFLCKFDGVDDFTSMTEEETEKILSDVCTVSDGKEKYKVLFSLFE